MERTEEIKKIQKLIKQGEEFFDGGFNASAPRFRDWKLAVSSYFYRELGKDSKEYSRFSKLPFRCGDLLFGNAKVGEAFFQDLDEAVCLLEKRLADVETRSEEA